MFVCLHVCLYICMFMCLVVCFHDSLISMLLWLTKYVHNPKKHTYNFKFPLKVPPLTHQPCLQKSEQLLIPLFKLAMCNNKLFFSLSLSLFSSCDTNNSFSISTFWYYSVILKIDTDNWLKMLLKGAGRIYRWQFLLFFTIYEKKTINGLMISISFFYYFNSLCVCECSLLFNNLL
jgi:hypothetical protein